MPTAQAEESEEEEEAKSEASYDYLSPFLPPLIGMQQLTRDQSLEVRHGRLSKTNDQVTCCCACWRQGCLKLRSA